MLLINPPVIRICEPPLGIIRLARFLNSRGIECRILDAGIEGLLYHLESPSDSAEVDSGFPGSGTWEKRAIKGRRRNLDLLRSPEGYANYDRYSRAVNDLQKALLQASGGNRIGLANYEDEHYSPVSRKDLMEAAADFERNPFHSYYRERIPGIIDSPGEETLGISLNFLSQAVCTFALLGYLNRFYPDIRIFLGGGLVTSWVRQGLLPEADTFSDLVTKILPGRGEESLASFLEADIRGVSFPDSEPEYDGFNELDLDSYLAPGRILPWNFTQGCAYRGCTFCPEKAEGNDFYSEPSESGCLEISLLVERYKPLLVHLTDSEITPPFLKSLINNPINADWYGFCRFSQVLEDPSFCRSLAVSGCRMLQLGLESGDQEVLDGLNKGIVLGSVWRILENLKEAGIGTYIYLLFGTPGENRRAALKTRDQINHHQELIDFLNLAIFNLPVSSGLASELDTRNFYRGSLSLYSEFVHPDGWDRGNVRRFLTGGFRAAEAVRKIINRTPPVFTSSHAPFFLDKV